MSIPKKPLFLSQKTTLLQLRREYNKKHVENEITSYLLAKTTGIAITDVYAVEIGAVTDPEIAQKVLSAFNALTNQDYTLETIVFTPRWISSPTSGGRMEKLK